MCTSGDSQACAPLCSTLPSPLLSLVQSALWWHHLQQDDLVGPWWWSVGCVRPSSPSFALLMFSLACHFWPGKGAVPVAASISSLCSSQWKLTAQLSAIAFCILPLNRKAAELYVFPGRLSCLKASMLPLLRVIENNHLAAGHLKQLLS